MSWPASRCQRTTASLSVRCHVAIASVGSAGSSMSRRPSAMRTSFACTIPSMPSLIVRRYWSSASMNALRVERRAVARREPPGDDGAAGCVSTTWYCSTNASSASFQFTGSRQAYHHSVRSDSTFHASRIVANGSMHCRSGGASSSRLIHAHPPHISHRTGTRSMSSGCRLCSANVRALRDVGVRAVEAVAPPVERAGEPALARPAALDDPDAAMAAGVLERAHAHVVGAQHDDRLVEDLVLDEVARLRGSPRAGTPSARPAATAARPPSRRSRGRSSAPCGTRSGNLHRVGHRERRPLLIHDRHAALLRLGDATSVQCRPHRYETSPTRRRRRRAGRRRRHHRHLPAVPRA